MTSKNHNKGIMKFELLLLIACFFLYKKNTVSSKIQHEKSVNNNGDQEYTIHVIRFCGYVVISGSVAGLPNLIGSNSTKREKITRRIFAKYSLGNGILLFVNTCFTNDNLLVIS
ncbi:MAG: hypothetical protein GY756_27590 [bacterium]|nr:hypothetical protein [bacterium]